MQQKLEQLAQLKVNFAQKAKEQIERNIASINNEVINPETKKLSRSKLTTLLVELEKALSPEAFDTLGRVFSNEELSRKEKIRYLAGVLYELNASPFDKGLEKFFLIIKTEEQLKSFLSDPYAYIYNNPNKHSLYELQTLQSLSNNADFYTFIGKDKPNNNVNLTKLAYKMYELDIWDYTNKRPNYGSTDAVRFDDLINPEVKSKVLEQAQKDYHGPKKTLGYGSFSSYTAETIKQTSEMVKREKRGACHSFAQLSAASLLEAIGQGEFPEMHFKLVSHDDGLGSHTFLLIEHNSDDLDDLSECIIVDPWAVAMGHYESYGVFTLDDYPFPHMTDELICCFDNQKSSQLVANQSSSMVDELKGRVSALGMFANTSKPNEPKFGANQKLFIQLIKDLKEHAATPAHKEVFDILSNQVATATRGSKDFYYHITKLAILALHTHTLEKTGDDKYRIAKGKKVDPEVLSAFPEKIIGVINDLIEHDKNTPLSVENLAQLAKKVHDEEEEPFNFSQKLNYNI
ncbi:MAG: hypothetical protein P4L79_09385 [Legionella sp.]|uniref:hypothetical protein n=1 Tax=Legionella sp. TaxID=459 RepID=UPI002842D928|nr:hypothetical protein [Legionella sp.]